MLNKTHTLGKFKAAGLAPNKEIRSYLDLHSTIYDAVKDDVLKQMLHDVVNDKRFQTQVGSKGHHHAYEGGLMVHTEEVLEQCLASAVYGNNANRDVLVGAAIYHDFNKIYEYEVTPQGIVTTPYRDLIRHVSGSYATFNSEAIHCGLNEDLRLQIGHCILAHHGRPEWGSVIEPQTKEAWILHFSDMMSARYGPRMHQ